MSGLDPLQLRRAFGAFPTGVTVVTACAADGRPVGFTANSFASVSLDPPMLLVCPARALSCYDVFADCQRFAVNVLAEGQEAVSNTFAAFKGDRFAKVAWRGDRHGRPLIDGAAATFSCDTVQVVAAGDHVVLLGAVASFEHSGERGLGYAGGHYFSLGLEREAASAPRRGGHAVAGAIIEHEGRVLLETTPDGYRPPQLRLNERSRVRAALAEQFANARLDIEIGKAYSIFDDSETATHYSYFLASAANGATGGLGEFVSIDTLATQRHVSPAHAKMMSRFAFESRHRSFGLYVGDEKGGEVHEIN